MTDPVGWQQVARRWSVVIVGARIAGAATAHALAPLAGTVLMLDRSGPSSYWPQQATWDRPGNLIWHDLGLAEAVLACGAPRLRGHTRRTLGVEVGYEYPIEDEHCYRMSVPREVLDPALAAQAARWGNVTTLRQATVIGVLRDGERVTGVRFRYRGIEHEVSCDLVVFADGRVSRNADRIGAEPYRSIPSPWTALLSYYRGLPLPPDRIRYSRLPGSMLIVTPSGPSVWCVATALHRDLIAAGAEHPIAVYHRIVSADPVVGPALAAGTRFTPVGGAGKLRMYRRPMTGPGWCLVGDSGFHLDPMSAQGTQAVLTTVRLLRDRVAELGRVSRSPSDYRDLTARRDILLAREWAFTEQILGSYGPGPEAVERARRLAADPTAREAELRVQMGLPAREPVAGNRS